MFEDILQEARGDLAGNDLGCVVIHHDWLHDPIVVPLRPWDRLNVDVVMEHIEKVLNSHQELSVNDSFDIMIGAIDLPKRKREKTHYQPPGRQEFDTNQEISRHYRQ